MKFKDVGVNREERYSVGIEEDSGKHYVSIPVSNGLVDYEEYYEIDQPTFERYRADPDSARDFVMRCRKREMDDRLIVKPGKNAAPRSELTDGPGPAAMFHVILRESMSDPARAAVVEEGLASSDPEDVYDAIIDVGKQRHHELVARVVPYLTSPTGFLREAALRTLVFHLHLSAYKANAVLMLDTDPDEGAREAAAMGLCFFAMKDAELLQHLVRVAINTSEEDTVRAAAFISALDAAGLRPGEFPKARALPGFEARADWGLLARVLSRAGHTVPREVVERAVDDAPSAGS